MSGARQVAVSAVTVEDVTAGQVVALAGQLVIVKAVYGDLACADVVHVGVLTTRGADLVLERRRGDLLDVVQGVTV